MFAVARSSPSPMKEKRFSGAPLSTMNRRTSVPIRVASVAGVSARTIHSTH